MNVLYKPNILRLFKILSSLESIFWYSTQLLGAHDLKYYHLAGNITQSDSSDIFFTENR